jgi:hypothetical protein
VHCIYSKKYGDGPESKQLYPSIKNSENLAMAISCTREQQEEF